MRVKTAFLIDGGYLRATARQFFRQSQTNREYNNAFIENFSKSLVSQDEHLFRIL